MLEQHFTVATPADFAPVIDAVLERASLVEDSAALIKLTGDLGAGKTTFTQQLAARLGIGERVVSPTFGIMKQYELIDHPDFDVLVHIDAYRIESLTEVGPLRFESLFKTPRTLICLEWPEQIAAILPAANIAVSIEHGSGEERRVTLT